MTEESTDGLLRRTAIRVAQLAETALHHSERLDRLDALLTKQIAIHADVKASLAGITTTLARVETLVARMIPPEEHGRDA
jgi:hypothetical protein